MALEDILSKISEDAALEAKTIIETASKDIDGILNNIRKEAVSLRDSIIKDAKRDAEFAFQKEVIAKKLSAKKDILIAKKSELDNCFKDALTKLLNLDDELYCKLIKNMLAEIDSKDEAEIVFSSDDKNRIDKDFIHKINSRLKLSFSDSIKKGFILKTKELIIDSTFDNILSNLRQDFESKAAERLF